MEYDEIISMIGTRMSRVMKIINDPKESTERKNKLNVKLSSINRYKDIYEADGDLNYFCLNILTILFDIDRIID